MDNNSILNNKHIHEIAFKRGMKDFKDGALTKVNPSLGQLMEINKRAVFIERKKLYKAKAIEKRFNENHFFLQDTIKDGVVITHLYRIDVAVSPFRKNTLWDKEWQRGFNTAFNKRQMFNLELNNRKV